ncbi:hypothetical protein Tco_0530106 [Tanacetum coccineum]
MPEIRSSYLDHRGVDSELTTHRIKVLHGASPSSEVMSLTYQEHSQRERPCLGTMKHTKPDTQESSSKSVSRPVTVCTTEPVITSVHTEVKNNEQESKINELTKLIQMLIDEKVNSSQKIQESKPVIPQSESSNENYKAQPYQYASPSKKILKANAKPFPACTHRGFNDHRPDDCCMYHECEICGSNDHATSGHNCVILVRGGVLAESSLGMAKASKINGKN